MKVHSMGKRLLAAGLVTLIGSGPVLASGETVTVPGIGALPPGKTVVIRFQATVNNPVPAGVTQVSNQGTVSGTNFSSVLTDDPVPGGTSDPTVTPINAAPDLALVKTDGVTQTTAGATLVYVLTVSNVGNKGATGVGLTETVPTGTTFTAASSSPGWSCPNNSPGGTTCTLTVGALAGGGASTTRNFAVTVLNPPGVTQILNNASVADDGTNGADPNPGNNLAADLDTLGPSADLSITKTDSRSVATPGSVVNYRITVANNGPDPITGAVVTDTLPPTLLGATWTCNPSGGATCTASGSGNINQTVNLPVGSSVLFRLMVTVSPSAVGSISNTAAVAVPAGASDPVPGNNSATDTDTLVPRAHQGDFDGNGSSDVVLFNATTGEVREWLMAGLVVGSNLGIGTQSNPNARVVGTGDYDGNGQSDLLWQDQSTGAGLLWLNGSATNTPLGPAPFAGAQVVGSGDYNGDGTSDILWHNPTTGRFDIWLMSGGAMAGSGTVGTVGNPWQIMASGDYDNDGMSDILWMNRATGMMGTFPDPTWQVTGTGRYNGDGYSDIVFFKPGATRPTAWFLGGGSTTAVLANLAKVGSFDIVGNGDYDGNGRADVLWFNATNGRVDGWLMSDFAVMSLSSQGTVGTVPAPVAQWTVVRTR
jgi:uncharacterized repeat protein (TIGR01451 family)